MGFWGHCRPSCAIALVVACLLGELSSHVHAFNGLRRLPHRPSCVAVSNNGNRRRPWSLPLPFMATTTTATDVPAVNTPSKTHTAAARAKISAANKGKVPWNAGKQHSEETKRRIAEKTREAMFRRKVEKAAALGYASIEEFEANKAVERAKSKLEKEGPKVKGLTEDGRRRLSESLKRRWQDPVFRQNYVDNAKGNRNHSENTRARISAAIKEKWQDGEYRAKVARSSRSAEVREKISQTLKAKWGEPEFREKMLTRSFPRTDEWRALVSRKIRAKWDDPTYRAAVTVGIQNSNKTVSVHRLRPAGGASDAAVARRKAAESKKRAKEAVAAAKVRDGQRRKAMQQGKAYVRAQGGAGPGESGRGGAAAGQRSLKDVLGKEVWFEEKMRRRRSTSDPYLDDSALEAVLWGEWSAGGTVKDDEEVDEDDAYGAVEEEDEEDGEGYVGGWEDSDEDDDGPRARGYDYEGDGEGWEDLDDDDLDGGLGGLLGDEGSDVIEVYDEDGELVGTYTAAEFDALKRSQHGR